MTVEKLRDRLCNKIVNSDSFAGFLAPGVLECIDSLISAVTLTERERIRSESQMVGVDEDCIKFIGSVDNYVGAAFLVPVDVMDPPVLAPTKGKP